MRQIVVIKYAPDATGDEGPWKNLVGRNGYLLVDGSNTFDRLFNGSVARAIEVGCWAHGRRRFVKIVDTDKRAAIPIKLIASLYQIEKLANLQGITLEKRLAVRQDKSKRILDRLFQWCEDIKRREPPASAMAKAIGYVLNQRKALSRFIENARLPLDNNLCEQQIRPIAVGRNNYLFVGSDVGGERAARHYSILRTCALNGVDPVDYLTDVFRKLAAGWPNSRIGELTPYGWSEAKKLADKAKTEAAG